MGFGNNSSKVLWGAEGLNLAQLKKVTLNARRLLGDVDDSAARVDVDMSWIIRKLGIGMPEKRRIIQVSDFLQTMEMVLASISNFLMKFLLPPVMLLFCPSHYSKIHQFQSY